jgi:deazaflavin-dependent oxidoreductase (nitroreductase family)
MNLLQRLRKGFLVLIKHTLNPVTRRIAHTSYGPITLVQHVGRRSGKQYETPIIASRVADGFVIELTYGYDVDWHKNVLAAGGCTLLWHGRQYPINHIQRLPAATGRAAFPLPAQLLLRLLGRQHFELLSFQTQDPKDDARP